ncbi:MAG: hypothetical protein ACD_71C00236G0005 [uncultured bacterium (gcode 4)]|uniref:Methyltransferase FkbM domain-containing protein n=1 Tax=uncultured bacterium (gcode 4) TaxID=1234023 RepID=K1YMA3_9BACT|nr:MAG: hypothetical protein ACD_71C00236G0005 [uncultured bacterium (gcode 4)]
MIFNDWILLIYDKLPRVIQRLIQKIFDLFKLKKWKKIHTTHEGIAYDLDLGELIDNSIYNFWFFERATHNAIKKLVKENMYCLDIWANIGAHTLTMAKLVWENWKVIAFEPMKWAFKKLSRNCKLNSFKNIQLNNIWLSDREDEFEGEFKTSWRIDGKNSVIEKQTIALKTLDDFVRENNINQIDFIKLDIDWYEYKMLSWWKKSIKKFKPIILFELWEYTLRAVWDSAKELVDLLEDLGYSFFNEENFEKYESNSKLLFSIPKNATINVICSTVKL